MSKLTAVSPTFAALKNARRVRHARLSFMSVSRYFRSGSIAFKAQTKLRRKIVNCFCASLPLTLSTSCTHTHTQLHTHNTHYTYTTEA